MAQQNCAGIQIGVKNSQAKQAANRLQVDRNQKKLELCFGAGMFGFV